VQFIGECGFGRDMRPSSGEPHLPDVPVGQTTRTGQLVAKRDGAPTWVDASPVLGTVSNESAAVEHSRTPAAHRPVDQQGDDGTDDGTDQT
jgi:hypothetical protein